VSDFGMIGVCVGSPCRDVLLVSVSVISVVFSAGPRVVLYLWKDFGFDVFCVGVGNFEISLLPRYHRPDAYAFASVSHQHRSLVLPVPLEFYAVFVSRYWSVSYVLPHRSPLRHLGASVFDNP